MVGAILGHHPPVCGWGFPKGPGNELPVRGVAGEIEVGITLPEEQPRPMSRRSTQPCSQVTLSHSYSAIIH